MTFQITKDTLTPGLRRLAAAAKHAEPVFRAMGTAFKNITEGNFKTADFRPAPWAAKKNGTPATLQKSGALSHSFHLTTSDTAARLSNPVVYARVHQFGSAGGKPIPPRPFFPVDASGKLTSKAWDLIAAAGHRALARQFGGE